MKESNMELANTVLPISQSGKANGMKAKESSGLID
jgi:hypothetical protein